ncbi:MAG: hypothetical protein JXN65_03015 [Clostridia bacterium]|nr:hypothetical protein [Clostridia bacterium]
MNKYDFVGDCPPVVSERIKNTLNTLPERRKHKVRLNVVNTFAVAAAALLSLFIVTWAVNPAMASGNTFRDMLLALTNSHPEAQEIIEAPMPAPDVKPAESETAPEDTAALITSDEQNVSVPAVIVDGYEFRLEDQILYDGAQLTVGYNVRKADGSPMPSVEAFTEVHMAGFIRMRELMLGDTALPSAGQVYNYNWDDPYIYRQVSTFDLRDVSQDITDETEFVLSIGVYDYSVPKATVEHFAYLPFCVNTSHDEFASTYSLEQSIFDTGDFTVEVMPIIESVTGTKIEVRTYKKDDPAWGKRENENMFVRIKTTDGTPIGVTASFGFGVAEDGSTYIQSIYELAADETLPKQLIIYFSCGDANTGEAVEYEPITITFK